MIGRIISSFVGTILAITVLDLLNSANEEQEKQDGEELNLIGKHPRDYTLGEIVRMKKYSADMFELVDKNTMGGE